MLTRTTQGNQVTFVPIALESKLEEVGLNAGLTHPYPHLKQYLFSQTMKASPNRDIELVSEGAIPLIKNLKEGTGKDIWLCGGANLATTLFAENLIDKIILKVNPFLIGSGIPLFAGIIKQTALELTDNKLYSNGVLMSHYRVKK